MATLKAKNTAAGKAVAAQGKSRRKTGATMTVAELLRARQSEVLADWLENIKTQAGTRTFELMTEEQLRVQTANLLAALTKAFGAEQYVDLGAPEFVDSVALLRDVSTLRAEQGFTPSETAVSIFLLRNAVLKYLQEEIGDQPELLNREVLKTRSLSE